MSAQSSVETLFFHVQLKLHLSFSVMNNSRNAFSHQLMTTLVLASDIDLKKTKADIELQRGRALSTEICLWLCKWGIQEGMQ
jgi:hypothetical protein